MHRALAPLGVALLVLSACHAGGGGPAGGKPGPAAKKTAPAESAADAAIAEVSRTMAPGVPVGTNSAPLDVRFDLASIPAPGVPFEIEVAVLPAAPAPVLRLEVSGGEGLTILDPDGPVAFEKVQAGSVARLHVRASSATAGTRLVEVRATLELPTGPEWRVYAFPVVVGSVPPPPAASAAPATP